jgi:hypothetical protein
MKAPTSVAFSLAVVLAVAFAGCGDQVEAGHDVPAGDPATEVADAEETSGGASAAGAACALVVRYRGVLYDGRTVAVVANEGRKLGSGVLPACDDGGGDSGEEKIELAEIKGVSPRIAVVWAGQPETVFIRQGVQPPPEIERLFGPPACDPRDEPVDLSGRWLGIVGTDGTGDPEPPYALELFVEVSSSPRYEGSFLTVSVPSSLGTPLTREDIETSLWEGGTISTRVGCAERGAYVAESVTADPPR